MFWKIYFWVITILLAITIIGTYGTHTPWNLGEWYQVIASVVSIIVLYLYAYKKQTGHPQIWRTFFFIEIILLFSQLIYLFSPIKSFIPIPETLQDRHNPLSGNLFLIGIVISIPYYIALYRLGQTKKMINNFISFGVAAFITLLMGGIFVYLLVSEGKAQISRHGLTPTTAGPCSRQAPYDMPEQISDSLDLVIKNAPKEFSNELDKTRNCLNIQFKDLRDDKGLVEGQFIFDPTSTTDNLRIYLDNSYQTKSPEFTALTLAHELIHVSQFLSETYYNKPPLTCAQKEYDAWGNEVILLYNGFTREEKNKLQQEINNSYQADAHVSALRDLIIEVNSASDLCTGAETSEEKEVCNWNNLRYVVQQKVDTSPGYKAQCGF